MPDITGIAAALGSIKAATDIAKLLKESSLSLEKAELKLKFAELISALADAKIEMSEIQELVLEKDRSIRELQEALNVQEALEWEDPYYWHVKDGKREGPYCQHCYDNQKKLIRLQGDAEDGYWECKACKNSYTDSNFHVSGPRFCQPESDF